jgi:hypothetical protein
VFAYKGDRRYYRCVQPGSVERFAVGVEPDWDSFPHGRELKQNLDRHLATARAKDPEAIEKALQAEERRAFLPPETTAVFDGKRLKCRMAADRYELWNRASLPEDNGWIKQPYQRAIFRTLPNALNPEVSRADQRLPDALSAGFVVERVEATGAGPCVVLSRPAERVWLDPALGYAVRKREFYDPPTGLVRERYTNDDFRDAGGGVWLPWRCHWELCGWSRAPEAYRGRPLVRYTFAVSKLELNAVPDALFEERIPAGIQVMDTTILPPKDGQFRAVLYVMPADLGDLEGTIEHALRREVAAHARARWVRLFLLANAVVLALVLIHRLVSRRRDREPAPPAEVS